MSITVITETTVTNIRREYEHVMGALKSAERDPAISLELRIERLLRSARWASAYGGLLLDVVEAKNRAPQEPG
jgi:hypothetical protein